MRFTIKRSTDHFDAGLPEGYEAFGETHHYTIKTGGRGCWRLRTYTIDPEGGETFVDSLTRTTLASCKKAAQLREAAYGN